jgi:hypothetical protein
MGSASGTIAVAGEAEAVAVEVGQCRTVAMRIRREILGVTTIRKHATAVRLRLSN